MCAVCHAQHAATSDADTVRHSRSDMCRVSRACRPASYPFIAAAATSYLIQRLLWHHALSPVMSPRLHCVDRSDPRRLSCVMVPSLHIASPYTDPLQYRCSHTTLSLLSRWVTPVGCFIFAHPRRDATVDTYVYRYSNDRTTRAPNNRDHLCSVHVSSTNSCGSCASYLTGTFISLHRVR